ncbi:glycosyltransferase family 2 protein [Mycolicibacterium sp. 050158]|uniref:glycosyltransferase family 2 protein n=1 Tax=Mycolicibacterium sp. 050158 TaxID=3090602 RepID=UPI00299ED377|nr:glycosyltransferase family 2 protein [Mycolicibacterium sp. 050158]MDX1888201.1 glycosyltransferase family 2 protein [Mycolicibacterium sp. 050158]
MAQLPQLSESLGCSAGYSSESTTAADQLDVALATIRPRELVTSDIAPKPGETNELPAEGMAVCSPQSDVDSQANRETRPDVFRVLTVHYNTPELTISLVREFPRHTLGGRVVSIHILDNCSTEENRRLLQDGVAGLGHVELKFSPKNVGFGEGLNALAADQRFDPADILWFLNPDTGLQPGCIEILERAITTGEYDVVSPLIYSGRDEGQWIWFCGGYISSRALRPRHELYGAPLLDAPREPFVTEFITGAAPMMRTATFRGAGGFPRGYFLYWEDAYLCWRLRNLGCRLGVLPAARLWHAVGASSGTGQSSTFYYWFARNRFRFARDTGMSRWVLLYGAGGWETCRIIAKAMREPRERMVKMRAASSGTIAGIRGVERN